MIPDKDPITPGMRVRHDEGLLYEVADVRRNTTGYEATHELGGMVVNYTQLEEGSFPIGTKWSKDEEDFRAHFTIEGGGLRRKDLTQDIRFNLGMSVVGLAGAGGVSYATIEFVQDNPSALEVTFGASSLGVLALYAAGRGAKNALKAYRQRRRLDRNSAGQQ